MRLTQFGETVLPELNGIHDLSQTARSNLLPLKYGAIDLDGNETVLHHKQISANAIINTDFDDTMDDLAYEAQKGVRLLKATMRDDTERQLLAKMSVFSRNAKADKYTCEQEYGFQWNAMYPYWLLTEHEPYYTNHGYSTDDGLTTGDGNSHTETLASASSASFTITNNSRVRIPKVYITYEINTGQIIDPILTNTTNGHYISLDFSWISTPARGSVFIDCLSKKCFGSFISQTLPFDIPAEYNLYRYITVSDQFLDWMILEPGDNDFTFSNSTSPTSAKIVIHWSNHYV